MALLDRYLQSVRFWLPRAEQSDILAELSEDIRSEVEEKESALARKLTDAEMEELLKRHGSPYRVASHYLPQRYLIGPAFFPLYLTVIKAITFLYLAPWLAAWLFMVTFLPSYRAEHAGWRLVGSLLGVWNVALYGFALVTIVIALMERAARGQGFADSWERKWNPEANRSYRIAKGDAVGQFLGGIVFALWWLGLIHGPWIEGLTIQFAPQSQPFLYWSILAVVLAVSALGAVNLFLPHWTKRRLIVRVVLRSLELVTSSAYLLMAVPVLVTVAGATPAQEALLTQGATWLVRVSVLGIGIYALADGLRGLWLLARGRYMCDDAPQTRAGQAAGTSAI